MGKTLRILIGMILLVALPRNACAMVELLPAFSAIVAVGIAGVGSLIGAALKTIIFRYVIAAKNGFHLWKVAAVTAWETFAISLAFLLAFSALEPTLMPEGRETWPFVGALFAYGITVSVLLALLPNSYLVRSRPLDNAAHDTIEHGIGTAAVLSLTAPLVTAFIALNLGLSLAW